jgi:hypothetical protein
LPLCLPHRRRSFGETHAKADAYTITELKKKNREAQIEPIDFDEIW